MGEKVDIDRFYHIYSQRPSAELESMLNKFSQGKRGKRANMNGYEVPQYILNMYSKYSK